MSTDVIGFRLSPQQKHLWSLQQDGYNHAYRVQCAVRITGELDHEILKAAIGREVERHEILRTVFHFLPGVGLPLQVVSPSSDFSWRERDLSDLEIQQQEIEVARLFEELAQAPIACERMPVLHALLVIRSRVDRTLIITMPAGCMDAPGLVGTVREIGEAYEACLRRTELDGEPLQYADLSRWLNDLLETEAGREYWREREGRGSGAGARLPVARTGQSEFAPGRVRQALPAATVAEIERLGEGGGYTAAAFLLGCWQVLLWRLTQASSIVVGTAFAGRSYPELEGALGLFTRYLPLEVELSGGEQLQEVVQRAAAALAEAAEWQEYFSWEEWAQPGGGGRERRQAYCSYAFESEEWAESFTAGEMQWRYEEVGSCVERYQVKLECRRSEEGVELTWHYDSAAMSAAAVERLAEQFATLMASACAEPAAPIARLEVVSESERVQVIEKWNQTAVPYEAAACLHQEFEQQVALRPEATAVVYEGAALSYAELNRRANQVAHYLREQGVGPEAVVGVLLERSVELVVSLLGVLKAGAAYLPLDASYPPARLSYMLRDAGVAVLLTAEELLERVGEVSCRVVCVGTEWEQIGRRSEANVVSGVNGKNVAYVIYTSGSTGQPKGVMITHGAIVNHMQWLGERYPLTETDAVLQKTPISFDASVWEFYAPLLAGGRLVLARPGGQQDSEYLVEVLRQEQVSIIQVVPSLLRLLGSEAGLAGCGALRRVFSGGERLTAELAEQLWQRLERVELVNLYGPTEATIDATYWQCSGAEEEVPIGRPVANLKTYVVEEQQQLAPVGAAGELLLGGAGLARGYLNCPDRTAEKFIPDPFSQERGARLYRTGDDARQRTDGVLEYLGRKDQQVKLRGYRIELEEIEVKLRAHHAVKEAVVLIREDEGQHARLVGYIVTAPGLEVTVSELRTLLGGVLPEFMIPSAWVFLKALPMTPNGKLDKKALPLPDESRPDLGKPYVKPRTPAEEVLAKIWAEVLGVDQVGVFDNFFELGGDSILGIQIVARSNQANIRLTPRLLFQYQTIADLQAVTSLEPIVQAEQGIICGPVPLTPIQHWFFESAFVEPHHFNQSFLFEVPGDLDPAIMEKAVGALIKHHDALRLRFTKVDQEWTQSNAGVEHESPFSRHDLTRENISLKTKVNELQRSLNLTDGPLLRVALFERGDGEPNWLLVIVHHLVVDGVSWRILLADLQLCYEQLSRGDAVNLPAKTTSYKHWAERLQTYAQTEELEREADNWSIETRGSEARVPVDFPNGDNYKSSARSVEVSLSEQETKQLLQEVPKVYSTQINDLLLAALLEAYRQWTGSHSLLIDLEGHGREEIFDDVDLSRTVGWFTSIYPVRLELGHGEGWQELLTKTKEHLRSIPGRGMGYGLLKYLNPRPEIRSKIQTASAAEISFNYLGQFDGAVSGSSLFRLARESSGEVYSPRAKRSYVLEINGIVVHGKLQLGWTYSEQIHQRETISRLAHIYMDALKSLIQHCLSQRAPSFTPSDFAEFKWSQAHLDEIAASIDQAVQLQS